VQENLSYPSRIQINRNIPLEKQTFQYCLLRIIIFFLTHLLRWWIAVADFIIYAGSVDNPYIDAKELKMFCWLAGAPSPAELYDVKVLRHPLQVQFSSK
jgi:hypothetical protein